MRLWRQPGLALAVAVWAFAIFGLSGHLHASMVPSGEECVVAATSDQARTVLQDRLVEMGMTAEQASIEVAKLPDADVQNAVDHPEALKSGEGITEMAVGVLMLFSLFIMYLRISGTEIWIEKTSDKTGS